jgi:hypothetical protein
LEVPIGEILRRSPSSTVTAGDYLELRRATFSLIE